MYAVKMEKDNKEADYFKRVVPEIIPQGPGAHKKLNSMRELCYIGMTILSVAALVMVIVYFMVFSQTTKLNVDPKDKDIQTTWSPQTTTQEIPEMSLFDGSSFGNLHLNNSRSSL